MLTLQKKCADGKLLQASFDPEIGLNLVSYKKDDLEIIDQSTRALFEERSAGLGALIGPHFHRRHEASLPKIPDESLFPHIQRVKAKGVQDPFSHGIARYAPWKVESGENWLKGKLSGKDTWKDVPLSVLEGQMFQMGFEARLEDSGLILNLSVVSDTDSLVGLHYYYRLPKDQKAIVSSTVQKHKYAPEHQLELLIENDLDETFHPYPDPLTGTIVLRTSEYQLETRYRCNNQENCWQLYHPKEASFVCIEPISASDPRHPNLTVSSLEIELRII